MTDKRSSGFCVSGNNSQLPYFQTIRVRSADDSLKTPKIEICGRFLNAYYFFVGSEITMWFSENQIVISKEKSKL
jgi:hypothetical protein